MKRMINSFLGFVFLGMFIVALVAGFILLSYLLIYGAIVGMVIFAIVALRNKLFPPKANIVRQPKQGRTFDHDDLK